MSAHARRPEERVHVLRVAFLLPTRLVGCPRVVHLNGTASLEVRWGRMRVSGRKVRAAGMLRASCSKMVPLYQYKQPTQWQHSRITTSTFVRRKRTTMSKHMAADAAVEVDMSVRVRDG